MRMTGKVADEGFKTVSADHYLIARHKIPRIWVLIADRHKMRVFIKPDGHLEQIAVAFPDNGENHSDNAKFIQEINNWLEDAIHEDAFDRLVLAASPKMLGDMRKALASTVQTKIVAEIDKDLTKMNEKDLMNELNDIVWF